VGGGREGRGSERSFEEKRESEALAHRAEEGRPGIEPNEGWG
jgi:hypothetical protein